MKSERAIPLAIFAALIIGAVVLGFREHRAAQCRDAVADLSAAHVYWPAETYAAGNINAALEISRQTFRRKVQDCYREGYLSTPYG